MRHFILPSLLILSLLSCKENIKAQIQPVPVISIQPLKSERKVQVAILFDTSNSMDGLIDQAKTRIWGIVNEINTLRYEGKVPTIEISLYEYGKSTLSPKDNYLRKIVDLTTDLDLISQELFALRTNGGEEYCGAVIQKSVDQLEWSSDLSDLKLIYIAGNERFDQGSTNFREACAAAKTKGIFISTIYCGEYNQGVRELWKEGASCSDGDYFSINSDSKIREIPTPFDERISSYNDSLNKTYFGYGQLGRQKKEMQSQQDENAASQSISSKSERAMAKSSSNYTNATWDIIDAYNQKEVDLSKLKVEELPQELKGKTLEQQKQFIAKQTAGRVAYQAKITSLSMERQKYIENELKKENSETQKDDFGSKVNESIAKSALKIGFKKAQ